MESKRIIRIQISGSKKIYQVSLDSFLQVLREREFNALQMHHASENIKLLNAMEGEAENSLYNDVYKNDVEYDI